MGLALSRLLALLGCGEEAACLAFDRLQGSAPHHALALASVAHDERVHDALLRGLMQSLPPTPTAFPAIAAMRGIHIRLGRSCLLAQCAGIAALDSAVCTLLSALLKAGSNIPPLSPLRPVLRRIRDDEARHVALTRRIALTGKNIAVQRDVAARTRHDLALVLEDVAGDFEQLGADPATLLASITRLPDGLLSA